MEPEESVVVPLVPTSAEPSTEELLRLLVNREALLIQRVAQPSATSPSGMVAQTGGAFAKAISQVTRQFGRATQPGELFQVVMPTGSVTRDLVPAVGGGYRAMVRAAGSTKFAGHARLVPVAAGGGAAVAAGPLIATVGLAVAGEMLAQHQVNKKLDALKNAVGQIEERMDGNERSVLVTAGQQARKVASYLLDQARIPSISSSAHAFGELDTLTNTYVSRMERWIDVAESQALAKRVYTPALLTALVGKGENQARAFEDMVVRTYEALALRARVTVLEKVAAEFSNPERSLPHVESVLRGELEGIADRQAQLVGLIDDLSVMPIDSSKIPVTFAGKGTISASTGFSRLARALHRAPDALPILNDADQTVLELDPGAGGMSILQPAPANREADGE